MIEDYEYLKKNMGIDNILMSVGLNVLKASTVTIPVVMAVFAFLEVLWNVPVYSKMFLTCFLIVEIITMVFVIYKEIDSWSIGEWIYSRKLNSDAVQAAAALSLIVATVVTLFLVSFATVIRYVIDAILYLTPLSVLPVLAFMYMLRFKYKNLGERVLWSLGCGYGIGAGLKVIGILLVLLVDVIGWQLTVLGVVCEVLISAFYLYIDLTEWVRHDMESKISEERRNEVESEIEMMRDIAKRVAR